MVSICKHSHSAVRTTALVSAVIFYIVGTRTLMPGLEKFSSARNKTQARQYVNLKTASASYAHLPYSVSSQALTEPDGGKGRLNFPYSTAVVYGFAGGMAGFSVGLVTSIFTAASFGLLPNFSTADALFLFGAASSVLGMVWGGYYGLSRQKIKASFTDSLLTAAAGFGVAFGIGLATGSNGLFWVLWPVLSLAGAVIGLRLSAQRELNAKGSTILSPYNRTYSYNTTSINYSSTSPNLNRPSSRARAREEGETVVGLRFIHRLGSNE